MNQNQILLIFVGMAVLALLVAALIPDIEAQDDQLIWQPNSLSTATATLTPTEGWFDDLPTPSYVTFTPTPDLTQTQMPTPDTRTPDIEATPTLGITDILITLTAESER
ncbi:MAG: hypothetical protein ISS57_07950 [Anaerolineales bacterium]|nr:hypothetical protein [Anaerolineales bacterium]